MDHHDITSISPQEAVARIKEKTLVTLTIRRGVAEAEFDQHVYDEIFYSDSQLSQQSLSQQDENMSGLNQTTFPRAKSRGTGRHGEEGQRYHRHPSSSTITTGSGRRPMHSLVVHPTNPTQQGSLERGSKDSGLSSGSSTHQEHEESRHGIAWRPELQQHHGSLRGSQGSQSSSNGRSNIEGSYEVEVRWERGCGRCSLLLPARCYERRIQSSCLAAGLQSVVGSTGRGRKRVWATSYILLVEGGMVIVAVWEGGALDTSGCYGLLWNLTSKREGMARLLSCRTLVDVMV